MKFLFTILVTTILISTVIAQTDTSLVKVPKTDSVATDTLGSIKVNAIKGTIEGVITSREKPVEFASVAILNTRFATSSNQKGYFKLENIPSGTFNIVFSAVGYDKLKIKITVLNNNLITINANLESKSAALNEVVVTGTMKEVSRLESAVPVEVYTSAFFRKNPTPSIFDALQNINGVRPQLNCNVCNTGDIHINGLEGPYTMVLIDGMPIVSGLSSVYGLSGIPNSLI